MNIFLIILIFINQKITNYSNSRINKKKFTYIFIYLYISLYIFKIYIYMYISYNFYNLFMLYNFFLYALERFQLKKTEL